MRDYSTLHLDTNTSKGTTLLLVFSVHSFHCHNGVFDNIWMSKLHTLKWVWNGPCPAVEPYSLPLPINATSGHRFWCYLEYII